MVKALCVLSAVVGLASASCGPLPRKERVANEASQPTVEASALPWPNAEANMIVNPLEAVTDDVMTYRFERGGATYLLVWTHPRTYYVELYKASGDKWTGVYEGATMGRPLFRQMNDHLQLFLVQPFFQIGEEEPRAGYDYYEVVTVNSNGVVSEIVELRTLED